MIGRIVVSITMFIYTFSMGILFLVDNPFEQFSDQVKAWHVGLLLIFSSPYAAYKGLKNKKEVEKK